MKENNVRCTHEKKKIRAIAKLENYNYCIECGSIIFSLSDSKTFIASKPISYQQNTEINPLSLYNNVIRKEFKIINSLHPYYKNRQKAISLLQKYSEYYKYS